MEDNAILEAKQRELKTGTTTLALVCTDGVILASDRRASMGYFIASKDVPKIFEIDEKIAMTVAGSVADAQSIVRIMQAEAKLYKLKHGRNINVKSAATLLSNIMFQYKFFPFYVQLLVAGVEEEPSVYSLDPLGGVTDEKCVSTGSGSPIAYGLLEAMYVKEGSIKENLKVAVRAISAAMKRDAATGEHIDLVTVTKSGFKRYDRADISKMAE